MIRLVSDMAMQEWWETGGGGGGESNGGMSLADRQRLAYFFGLDPATLSADEVKELQGIVSLANSLGQDPSQIQFLTQLKDAGFLTPTMAQKLLFGDEAGGGSAGSRLASDDPRYWDLQYAQLASNEKIAFAQLQAQLKNAGLDAESARRQALTTLITNRNNTAVDVANVSANVAKTAAEFAANPRDTYAEGLYRAQVGGATPFGDTNNPAFGAYGKALADKTASIFQPVSQDIQQARVYRDAIPQVEFYGPETRAQLGLPPTSAQTLAGASTGTSLPVAAPASNTDLQGALQFIKAVQTDPRGQAGFAEDLKKWAAASQPAPLAEGGKLDFGGIFDGRDKPGYSPSSSEGGTNLNIHERAVIVGESGQVYATLGEKRPDGTVRAEQLQIKPLPSEVEKDKKLKEAGKAIVETQRKTMASFAEGGTSTFGGTSQEKFDLFEMLLKQLGGAGGGTQTPFAGTRHLAGAPANTIMDDPYLKGITEATYSQMGIRPEQLWADIAKFSPSTPQNNFPRISFA